MGPEFVLRVALAEATEDVRDLRRVELEFATVTLDALGIPTTLDIMWFARQIDQGSGLGVRPILRLPDFVQYTPSNDHLWIELREGEATRSVGPPVTVFLRQLEPVAIEIHLVAELPE